MLHYRHMSYKQLVDPNLSTIGNVGWCLAFMENVFGTPHMYATATDAWNSVQFPHPSSDFPSVAVPVWFTYFEGGINYGHVALLMPDGRVLSSPYRQNNTQQWFSSITECAHTLRCNFIGWSEDIATIRVVEPQEDIEMIDHDSSVRLWRLLRPNVEPSEDTVNSIVGRPFKDWLVDADAELGGRNQNLAAQAQLVSQLQQTDASDKDRINALTAQLLALQVQPLPPTQPTAVPTPSPANHPTKVSWFVRFLNAFSSKKA